LWFSLELCNKPKLENNDKVKNFLNLHWGSFNIVSKGKHNIFLQDEWEFEKLL